MMALWQPQETKNRLKMIKMALEHKNPEMYQELSRKGELTAFVKEREKQMMEDFDLQTDKILHELVTSDQLYHERVQNQTMATAEAWENVLANYLEFQTTE
jgi:hypothetical protein